MISHLRGKIVHRSPTEIVVDVNGVGYRVNVSITTSEKLHESDSAITILTHLHVREDLMQLYGFATEAERDLFRLLISVSGIGPKMAQGILSGMSPAELREAIVSGNILVLTSISGVGKIEVAIRGSRRPDVVRISTKHCRESNTNSPQRIARKRIDCGGTDQAGTETHFEVILIHREGTVAILLLSP
ncbi:MAG: Holliday junction branch migration protein RuvA [Ignavibacteriae bacterium]|nr:Holliday junction branch migration protein RuvA [Ignavibacteriota bacterium]